MGTAPTSGAPRAPGPAAPGRRTVTVVVALTIGTALGVAATPAPRAAASTADPESATYYAEQWGLTQIDAPAAWALGTGTGVRIGIVDTGVDLGHPDLAGRVVAAATCLGTGGDPSQCVTGPGAREDDNGHGTDVAGIAGASGIGVAGVAPGASFVVAKVLDADGSGSTADVAAGIDWVVAHGAQVVNLSLGSDAGLLGVDCAVGGCSDAVGPAVEQAWQDGAVPVIAAGNDAGDLFGPAGYGDLDAVVVAATGPDGELATYSSTPGDAKWGVLAPGGDDPSDPSPACGRIDTEEIVSTYWAGQSCYASDEGTSMATPFVSGTLALLLGRGLSAPQAVDTLMATLDRSVTCGAGQGCQGLVDAGAAMRATAGSGAGGAPPTTAVASTRSSGVASSPSTAPPAPFGAAPSPVAAGGRGAGDAASPGASPSGPGPAGFSTPGAGAAAPFGNAASPRSERASSGHPLVTLALLFVLAGLAATAAVLVRRTRRRRPGPRPAPPNAPDRDPLAA